MMRRLVSFATWTLAGAACFATIPSVAAQTTGEQGRDIIVNGTPVPKSSTVQHQARAVSDATDRYETSLARFPAAVCPAVYGLAPVLNPLVAERLRKDAAAIGIPVETGKCAANALVIFVADGQAEIKAAIHARPELFAGLTDEERRVLAAAPGPVHVWRRIGVYGRQGDRIDNAGGLDTPSLKVDWPSHLVLSTQLAIEGSIMVVDLAAAEGKSVAQLADYAAMRLYAQTRPPEGQASIATILSLFDSPPAPRVAAMTPFDVAYLKTVYRAAAGQPAFATLGSVSHTLKANPAARPR